MTLSRQILEDETARVRRVLEDLDAQVDSGSLLASFSKDFVDNMGLFQDFGFITESYDLLESVIASSDVLVGEDGGWIKELARLFQAHMDHSRGKNRDHNCATYQSFQDHSYPLIRAHAQLGEGINLIHQGKPTEAKAWFRSCQEAFVAAEGMGHYVIKGKVLEIMALRIEGKHEDAFEYAVDLLQEALSVGIPATASILLLYSVLAGHKTFIGNKYEAESYSWQAVKLAKALPPSKASGFALYQHARVLHGLGNMTGAIKHIKLAEPILKVFDPIARVANLMLWFQCLKRQEAWHQAWILLNRLLETRFVDYFWEDLAELFDEGIDFYLQVYDVSGAKNLLDQYIEYAMQSKQAEPSVDQIRKKWSTLIEEVEDQTNRGQVYGVGSQSLIVDFRKRKLIKRTDSDIIKKSLVKAPSLYFVLDRLLHVTCTREPLISQKKLLTAWVETQESLGKKPKDPGKTIRRSIGYLKEINAIESYGVGRQISYALSKDIETIFIRGNEENQKKCHLI